MLGLCSPKFINIMMRIIHWSEKVEDFFEIAKEFIDIKTVTIDDTSDYINTVTYKKHTRLNSLYRKTTKLADKKYLTLFFISPSR